MISHRINGLRQYLQSMGLRPSEADDVCRSAMQEIGDRMRLIVESAVSDAESQGVAMGADEFLSQIKLDADSGYVQISTDSGELDFSLPPTPMLPWLLKNAKIAKDGSRYKIIPIGAAGTQKPKPAAKDIAAGLNAISSEGSSVENMAQQMAQAFTAGALKQSPTRQEPRAAGEVSFRVASDKQDPTRQWVAPAKDLDLTGMIMDINSKIRQDIDRACDDILLKYQLEAESWRS
jgi:hypothetical protein